MRPYCLLALITGVTACENSVVPNFNAPTAFPHNQSGVQVEFTGVLNGMRPDAGNWAIWSNALGRDVTYFISSEPRFQTELLGNHAIQPDDFIGGTVWDLLFKTVKGADTVIAVIPTINENGATLPRAQQQALFGALETMKALNYMYLAESRDTNGVPIHQVGATPSAPLAPILCNELVWKEIVAMLDSAQDSLVKAGPAGVSGLSWPPSFNLVSSSAVTQQSLTMALRVRARIEYAWAIARQNGRGATATSPGSPNVAQLDSALADIRALQAAGVLWAPLSLTAANPNTDAFVSHSFSTASGDLSNPIFADAPGYYAIFDAMSEIDTTDARFLVKFTNVGAGPTAAPAPMLGSTWIINTSSYMTGQTPLPIVRSVQLRFYLAQIYLGLRQFANAATVVDSVRRLVGGLPSALTTPAISNGAGVLRTFTVTPTDYASVRDFFLREQRVSLLAEGQGDRVMALRDFNVAAEKDTTFIGRSGPDSAAGAANGRVDLHTTLLPIPSTEADPRGGNITPTCSGAPTASIATRRAPPVVRVVRTH